MAKKKDPGVGIPIKEFSEAVTFARAFAASDKASVDASASRALHFQDGLVWARSGSTWIVRDFTLPGITGPFAVSADALSKAVQAVESQGAELTLALDKTALVWRGGAAKGRIALIADDPAQMPDIPEGATGVGDTLLAAALARVSFTAYRGEQWPMLRGIYWGPDGRVMASDGDRLAAVRIDESCPAERGVLVPEHLLRAMKGFAMTCVDITEREIVFGGGASWVAGTLLQAEFPHERIASSLDALSTKASTEDMTRVDLDSDQPIKALLQAVAASTEAPLHAVTVTVAKGKVEVQCEREDGEVRVELAARFLGADRVCRINAQYLIAAVEQGFPLYFGDKCLYTADDERKFEHAVMFFAA